MGLCFGAAIIMWLDVLDVNEPLQKAGEKDDRRTKAEQ
ncbi:hypothetical protein J2Z65_001521 [Paenibacillus aceris]|uniref:Uncharacterized protein n=1 Tax=Paenibacillus aceris TaxID=869555 RepID=A0ABS4HUN7_9BACL|nr:hypothetical protein [Paenibacillus aceris]